jgi:chromosome segregation ATPase
MGANSAKAMRAGGMDDVIFAGSGNRPARNHADVTLTIDNADRTAPAQFNDDPVLEVVRRIDRGEGSTYRINGREVRARDVQLLFADASTGANSPALVRQGQISELIGAKPQNRRRILEEAAGVSGLHTRRHEAELRLRAAEANLSRLEDVARELETALNRLRREARQAEKYKRLSAEIRAVQGAVLYARWTEARDTLNRTQTEATEAARSRRRHRPRRRHGPDRDPGGRDRHAAAARGSLDRPGRPRPAGHPEGPGRARVPGGRRRVRAAVGRSDPHRRRPGPRGARACRTPSRPWPAPTPS